MKCQPPPDDLTFLFVKESNEIESILRDPTPAEVEAHIALWALTDVTIDSLIDFLKELSNTSDGAALRSKTGYDIRIGAHVPPRGGSRVVRELEEILKDVREETTHPFLIHQRYEALHPFMDGNGRSGRALWAYQMLRHGWHGKIGIKRLFLHEFYYQMFDFWRKP